MNKGDLVKEVAKVVCTKKRPRQRWIVFFNHHQGIEKEGCSYTDWFRNV